jgi:hypothetical protein
MKPSVPTPSQAKVTSLSKFVASSLFIKNTSSISGGLIARLIEENFRRHYIIPVSSKSRLWPETTIKPFSVSFSSLYPLFLTIISRQRKLTLSILS